MSLQIHYDQSHFNPYSGQIGVKLHKFEERLVLRCSVSQDLLMTTQVKSIVNRHLSLSVALQTDLNHRIRRSQVQTSMFPFSITLNIKE